MNTFASHLIASKMSLLDFIDLSLEAKLASFGLLVGSERMVRGFSGICNDSQKSKPLFDTMHTDDFSQYMLRSCG